MEEQRGFMRLFGACAEPDTRFRTIIIAYGGVPLSQFRRLSLIIVDSIERHGEIIARLKLFQAGYLDYQPPSIYNELPESAYLISFVPFRDLFFSLFLFSLYLFHFRYNS